jgi:hypothetical protein
MSIDTMLLLHSENIPFVKEYPVEDGGKKIAQEEAHPIKEKE